MLQAFNVLIKTEGMLWFSTTLRRETIFLYMVWTLMELILISDIIRGEPPNPLPRVLAFIAELPIGITNEEIANVLKQYGSILNIASIDKVMYGRKIDTGDRVVTFSSINDAVPSYVHVRGWRAFVKYRGQVSTCKICGDSGHLAKNCPKTERIPSLKSL